ncbi:MAG: bifunctional folylpolyglutamate synthase/dihydrofolate synthase [Paludibacter sp.]|nr:bifunctional folylpolyglutamate synthase/dihydrofolate synthase [Bacteroidales bacterium]MCM1069964.1 bifunctional folylpolyglutamate synthase/dihydrofolate synthase [Prevotella sp.]MCM1354550.1 bifunctional folylpolyglutamate synthase/dihydrofolate synthase [Bacteroides sp.]MCM1443561.1 bifunctional folylpolyglutamate synthase/dihydrofolate synthase [Muribaculum sp.]MCM1482633.1 bifunctional folylpolyglutamate synthase/dihydrofolate synthase [Paludibacter sp.]
MTYEETIAYLYASQPVFHLSGASAYKPGFANILHLLECSDNPHERLRCVHIAGTNGKGSTSHLIAATLQAAGYKTGLYTSPHLVDFRERIRIDGVMIPQSAVVEYVAKHKTLLEDIRPSFFETTTAMAFWYFAQANVDIAVIETGLGGRLDSTNVIQPLLSVITNIGKDHTDFLGHTLAAIASEKAGIIKAHIPVVIGETHPETTPVFIEKATELHSPIVFADQQPAQEITCQLVGIYQQKNKQTARIALETLCQHSDIRINTEHIAAGYAQVCSLTGLRGRWDILSNIGPTVICDTGHNSHGIGYVAEQLKMCAPRYRQLRIVFGMVNDKDVETVLDLLPKEAIYYFCQARTHRAIPSEELLHMGIKHGLQGKSFSSVSEAFSCAQAEASIDDLIFTGGSNYVVGELLASVDSKEIVFDTLTQTDRQIEYNKGNTILVIS